MAREIRIEHQTGAKFGSHAIDAAIAALAERQHGVVSRAQLVAIGVGRRAIMRRIEARRLQPVHSGVYAVGHRRLSPEGRWLAAVLAGGRGAVLSHASAAQLWGLPAHEGGLRHVTAANGRRRPGIHFHRCTLAPTETATKRGIPVTTPNRTLLDLASTVRPEALERALREALYQRITSTASLAAFLSAHRAKRGAAALRRAIVHAEAAPGITRSKLERRFLTLLRRHGLPLPELNVQMRIGDLPIEADCLWREARLIVELDSHRAHGTPQAFEADRARDRALHVVGWRVIRITWRQVRDEGPALAADLSRLQAAAARA